MTFRNGLASLLRPEDSVLVLIDHQPYQLANLNSHEPQMVINNTAGLAKAAKAFGVPTILTSCSPSVAVSSSLRSPTCSPARR
jgi:nicotinamidase-related amidase